MGQVACATCQNLFPADDLVYSEAGKICQSCELDQSAGSFGGGNAMMNQITAVLFAVAPFLASYQTGAGLTVFSFGLQTHLVTQGQDHVAFFGGLLALAFGAASLKAALPTRDVKGLGLAGLVLASGLLNVLVRSGYLY